MKIHLDQTNKLSSSKDEEISLTPRILEKRKRR
jgi:hypothetical protein